MAFKASRSHFRAESQFAHAQVSAEMLNAEAKNSGRSVVPLPNQCFMQLMRYYPPVVKIADLDTLPDKLRKNEEFGFSPVFDPHMIDECCVRGIFPLALCIGQQIFIFAPKLHEERSVCALVDSVVEMQTIKCFPLSDDMEGAFTQKKMHVNRRLTRSPSTDTCEPAFDVFVNRKEDWADAITMIKEQHGDNWLCGSLRTSFYWMFQHPDDYATKIVLIVIRRHKYDAQEAAPRNEILINEGDMVAAELGYVVGDVYTSATGAYCLDGAGTLQLAVTGELTKQLGCKVWDLGMKMDYKKQQLGCVEIRRKKWQQMMKEHKDIPSFGSTAVAELLSELCTGCPVTRFLHDDHAGEIEQLVANPSSKAQLKKRQKIENAHKRKNTDAV